MPNALLFREPSPGGSQDRYESLLRSYPGYSAQCVPVLETVHTNIEDLARRLLEDHTTYSGVVITSKRSCDAFREALQSLCTPSSTDSDTDNNRELLSRALAFWSTIPFYVVGEATASAIRNVQTAFQARGFSRVIILGEASGTGEQLGRFIVKDHPPESKDLLYLTGDKNRDTVATLLQDGGIAFQALQVYETRPRSDFEASLKDTIQSIGNDERWWLVYFAPSSAGFVAPIVKSHPKLKDARIAAIGPVTSNYLRDDLGIPVHVVSPKPKPEDLAHEIIQYDKNN